MKPQRLAAALALACCCLAVHAQSMKPGLWEINNKMGGSPKIDEAMAQMQKQMASMPPEQRKMVQDMMAKNGVAMGSGTGGGMSIKACITKEMAERNEMPSQHQGDCKTTTSDRTSSGMKMAFTCTNPPSSGEGQINYVSNEAYTMKMVMKSMVDGKPENTTMNASGKWLTSDCGSIKPMQAPTK